MRDGNYRIGKCRKRWLATETRIIKFVKIKVNYIVRWTGLSEPDCSRRHLSNQDGILLKGRKEEYKLDGDSNKIGGRSEDN